MIRTSVPPVQVALPGMPMATWEPDEAPDSTSDEFYTPAWVLKLLPAIDLDPCSPPHRPVPARNHYVLSEGSDGLALPWRGVVFCNPPYSRGSLPRWCRKAKSEWQQCNADAVLALVPARPGSTYWHDDVWGWAEVGFFNKRISFDTVAGSSGETGMFDSALVAWCKDWRLMDALRESTAEHIRWVR